MVTRVGELVFNVLWSYVKERHKNMFKYYLDVIHLHTPPFIIIHSHIPCQMLTPKPKPSLHSLPNLPYPQRRPRRFIIPRIRRILSQIHQNPRIATLVRARKRRQRRRRPGASTRDLNLRASQIELRFVRLHRHMQRDVLDAEKVVAVGRG
jgi:hypothetical protein